MIQDLRFAFRQLWKAPGLHRCGRGGARARYRRRTPPSSAWLIRCSSRRRPTRIPREIVQLFSQDKKDPKSFRAFSYPTFRDVRDQNTVFSGPDGAQRDGRRFGREREHASRPGRSGQFELFFCPRSSAGLSAASFLPEEEKPGSGQRVAIVSHRFWKKHSRDPASPRSHAAD